MGSICGPPGTEDAEGTVGMAGGGLGCGQVADTRGPRAVPMSPEALVICRGEGGHRRSEDKGAPRQLAAPVPAQGGGVGGRAGGAPPGGHAQATDRPGLPWASLPIPSGWFEPDRCAYSPDLGSPSQVGLSRLGAEAGSRPWHQVVLVSAVQTCGSPRLGTQDVWERERAPLPCLPGGEGSRREGWTGAAQQPPAPRALPGCPGARLCCRALQLPRPARLLRMPSLWSLASRPGHRHFAPPMPEADLASPPASSPQQVGAQCLPLRQEALAGPGRPGLQGSLAGHLHGHVAQGSPTGGGAVLLSGVCTRLGEGARQGWRLQEGTRLEGEEQRLVPSRCC